MAENPQSSCLVNYAFKELVESFNPYQNFQEQTRNNNIICLILATTPDCIDDIKVVTGMFNQVAVIEFSDIDLLTTKKQGLCISTVKQADSACITTSIHLLNNSSFSITFGTLMKTDNFFKNHCRLCLNTSH